MRPSPWRRGRRLNEKSVADNVRVLVTMEVKHARSRSPFRTLKPISNGADMPPWRRRNNNDNLKEVDGEPKTELHESEINIFKQLCLDKQDENAAIEILLDSAENTASSKSTDHGSRAMSRKKVGSTEGKTKFLDRLFFKSLRKSSTQSIGSATDFLDSSKENNHSWSHSSNVSDDPSFPSPPSSIPRTRISIVNTSPAVSNVSWTLPALKPSALGKVEKTRSILDNLNEGGDTVSNVSGLSGTRTGSLITPVTFNRHESLGFESIKDIRKCLKEMERQLGQATHKGQRVSR